MMHRSTYKIGQLGFHKDDSVIGDALRTIREQINIIEAKMFKAHPTKKCRYCGRPVYKGKTVTTRSGEILHYHKDCFNKRTIRPEER